MEIFWKALGIVFLGSNRAQENELVKYSEPCFLELGPIMYKYYKQRVNEN